MIYLAATLLTLLNTVWLALVAFGLPGTWLMVASAMLVAWWQWDHHMFSPVTLVIIVAMAAAGEVAEFALCSVGAARAGGGFRAALAALGGGLAGSVAGTFVIPLPLLGTLIGGAAGAAAGALYFSMAKGVDMQRSLRVGLAAGTGRLAGTAVKLAIAVVVWLVITVAAFWP
jgi:uncharacterized protein